MAVSGLLTDEERLRFVAFALVDWANQASAELGRLRAALASTPEPTEDTP